MISQSLGIDLCFPYTKDIICYFSPPFFYYTRHYNFRQEEKNQYFPLFP